MKLARLSVIARIDQLLAEAESAHAAKEQQKLEAYEKALTEWRDTHSAALLATLRAAVDVVRKGRYPYAAAKALNSRYYRETDLWGGIGAPPERTPHTPSEKLVRLRAILTDCTDDEYVTTSVLRELGFSPALFINAS